MDTLGISTVQIFSLYSLFLNSVNASLCFTEKGILFHNILPLKRIEFIPKWYYFTCTVVTGDGFHF